ncbi:conserved hypothetical protein, membrane [Candidatus Magnetomorum sp. HK-1]|nr:conserved hypothetical protein, membrane [Candidatus Magnetomorum sp. HK-1]
MKIYFFSAVIILIVLIVPYSYAEETVNERLIRIEETIKSLTNEMRQGFKNIDQRFKNIDQRFEDFNQNINQRFEDNDKRFVSLIQNINQRFEENDKRFVSLIQNIDQRFEENDKRFVSLIQNINQRFEDNDKRFGDFIKNNDKRFEDFIKNNDKRFEDFNQNFNQRFENNNRRFDDLRTLMIVILGALFSILTLICALIVFIVRDKQAANKVALEKNVEAKNFQNEISGPIWEKINNLEKDFKEKILPVWEHFQFENRGLQAMKTA